MGKKTLSREGLLFVISGPSGCGKTTLGRELLQSSPELVRSVSVTTRPRRQGEKEGREYFFVSRAQFIRLRKQNKFLEWARVFSHFYGTPRDFVLKTIAGGKDVLLIIDVQGAMQIKQKFPQAIFIFINTPSPELLGERLRKRGLDLTVDIERRIRQAKKELAYRKEYDYEIINDRIETARERLKAILIAEGCRIRHVNRRRQR